MKPTRRTPARRAVHVRRPLDAVSAAADGAGGAGPCTGVPHRWRIWITRKERGRSHDQAKVDRRGKVILSLAAAAAVLVNAGAAWAYWMVNGGAPARRGRPAVELALTGKSDDSKPLYPGGTTNLTVTVTIRTTFPIRSLGVAGDKDVTADSSPRDAGAGHGSSLPGRDRRVVGVPKNTIALHRARRCPDDKQIGLRCQGRPSRSQVRANGVSNARDPTVPPQPPPVRSVRAALATRPVAVVTIAAPPERGRPGPGASTDQPRR